jgi:uncharacterized membrane-anchored protein YhcB (DUF1043 family)
MGSVGWLLVVAAAIALGFSAGRLWPGSKAKITELERDRDAAREDLRSYRQDVNMHFGRTAELFDKVTADYRGLYEHLALGARQLGSIRGESVAVPLAEPEQRRLARSGAGTEEKEPYVGDGHEPAPESKLDSKPEPKPEPELNTEPELKQPPPTAADTGSEQTRSAGDAQEPATAAPAADKPVAANVEPFAQPANDEQVQPREATTGR